MKAIEEQLHDVMEITDTELLKSMLPKIEAAYSAEPNELNKARLGIFYHEMALNLSFLSKTYPQGYAEKSYALLTELMESGSLHPPLLPFVAAYQASALSLLSAETKKLRMLQQAFTLLGDAIQKYGDLCYAPEFLRGSIAENLPWFLFKKKSFAKKDFSSIIAKQAINQSYAPPKIMSFTYWAWANQHRNKRYRNQALSYLKQAMALDPTYEAARPKAEALYLLLSK